jgi:hypothetical protein
MTRRAYLICFSAIFAILGIVADQYAFQIEHKSNALKNMNLQNMEFQKAASKVAERTAAHRDRFFLELQFDYGPSATRLKRFSREQENIKTGKGVFSLFDRYIPMWTKFAKDEAPVPEHITENLKGLKAVEDAIVLGGEDWTQSYYLLEVYYGYSQIIAYHFANLIEETVSRFRIRQLKFEFERQLALSLAIACSLFSLAALVVYVQMIMREYVEKFNTVLPKSTRQKRTNHFQKKYNRNRDERKRRTRRNR